jgi:hypothetical protein
MLRIDPKTGTVEFNLFHKGYNREELPKTHPESLVSKFDNLGLDASAYGVGISNQKKVPSRIVTTLNGIRKIELI